MLGRNAAYVQQFVRRDVPKRLKHEERRKLARYFSVPETCSGTRRNQRARRRASSASSAILSRYPWDRARS
jgi:hypothetical protein